MLILMIWHEIYEINKCDFVIQIEMSHTKEKICGKSLSKDKDENINQVKYNDN